MKYMLFIWLIGYLFTFGFMYKTTIIPIPKEIADNPKNLWSQLFIVVTIISFVVKLLVLWPLYLGLEIGKIK